MHPENQDRIKRLADEHGTDSLVVVLGAADLEAIEVAAETLTAGDPAYVGPLAGVPLGLPVYHILEPALRQFIPEAVYEEHVGIWTTAVDTEEIGKRFKALREKVAKG